MQINSNGARNKRFTGIIPLTQGKESECLSLTITKTSQAQPAN